MKNSDFALALQVISTAVGAYMYYTLGSIGPFGNITIFLGGVFLICKAIEDK